MTIEMNYKSTGGKKNAISKRALLIRVLKKDKNCVKQRETKFYEKGSETYLDDNE